MNNHSVLKSDVGAQAAWKGFTSQTFYIANRLINDEDGYEYYPEDIEDLIIKNNGIVIEAVQVKNIDSDLSLSNLASSKTSQNGDGFFRRMCNLHNQYPSFDKITVACFGSIGPELLNLREKREEAVKNVKKKLIEKHGLKLEEADWLVDALSLESVSLEDLKQNMYTQISSYVPAMPAPHIAENQLIYYISKLSYDKGFITKKIWKNSIHEIGVSISAIDGFYKEYNKSLVRLTELQLNMHDEQIKKEYLQGVSAEPTHIRLNLDLLRPYWLEKIQSAIYDGGVAVVKGVSGQGKSTLCYRYLIDNFPEENVFCVRKISNEDQALNLVTALDGLGKHNENLIIYIDVKPGETQWAFLLQELQSRGMRIPVLISIRDEDYNSTPMNGKSIKYEIIKLELSIEEAHKIYNLLINGKPSTVYRTFEDIWKSFGEQGPLIEFIYLLTNEKTLKNRIEEQIKALISEKIDDEWIDVLGIVSYAGRLGCSVNSREIKRVTNCSNMVAAIKRLEDEYLIRVSADRNKIEALHPVRAQIIYDVLCSITFFSDKDIFFRIFSCISSENIQLVLLDYFSRNQYDVEDVYRISQMTFSDWLSYASTIKSMIWLDCKCYVGNNIDYIFALTLKYGDGWQCLIPIDFTGFLQDDDFLIDRVKEFLNIDKSKLQEEIDNSKQALTSLVLDYENTDIFLSNSKYPTCLPDDDNQRSSFGYSLFWIAKRGMMVKLPHSDSEIVQAVCDGSLQSSADAIRGLFEQVLLEDSYRKAAETIKQKIISEMRVIYFTVTEEDVCCKFIPPILTSVNEDNVKVDNQYWRIKMLNILQQIYPNIEYIDIELVGVNLLEEFGIPVMDNKIHIHKSNRIISWISEINSMIRVRIEFALRPSTWPQYVSKIDEIRKCIVNLSESLIKIIDDVYKKGGYTKSRGKKVDENIQSFKQLTKLQPTFPTCTMDLYCLYSENTSKKVSSDYSPMPQSLSVKEYEKFRSSFNDMCFSLDNFYNQFSEVFLMRVAKQDITKIKNLNLSMLNLYNASKALHSFQQEYDTLFLQYSTLDEHFKEYEEEKILTLVNMWNYVLKNPPCRPSIAYKAKQKYRKGYYYFKNALAELSSHENIEVITTDKRVYIKTNACQMDDTVENAYLNIVILLQNVFKSADLFSSDRWYLETQPLEFALISEQAGAFLPVAYSIPIYKLFDSNVKDISKQMIPLEIESGVLNEGESISVLVDLKNIYESIGTMRLYLMQFNQVLQVPIDERCEEGMSTYITTLIQKINDLWAIFLGIKELEIENLEDENSNISALLNLLNESLAIKGEILAIITERKNPKDAIKALENIITIIITLGNSIVESMVLSDSAT